MIGLRERLFQDFRAPVSGSLDGDLIAGAEREIAAVLAADSFDVFEELVQVELFGLTLQPVQVDPDALASLVDIGDPLRDRFVLGSSILGHRGKTKGHRCDV